MQRCGFVNGQTLRRERKRNLAVLNLESLAFAQNGRHVLREGPSCGRSAEARLWISICLAFVTTSRYIIKIGLRMDVCTASQATTLMGPARVASV